MSVMEVAVPVLHEAPRVLVIRKRLGTSVWNRTVCENYRRSLTGTCEAEI
jgi:hypothetical protein